MLLPISSVWAKNYSPRPLRIGIIKIVLLVLLCTFFASCFEDSDCVNLRNNIIGIAFKKEDTGQADALMLDTVLVANLKADSPYAFRKGQGAIDQISLPLNPGYNQQEIEFVIYDHSKLIHRTLELTYNVKTQFESKDCEPKFLFSDLAVTRQDFIAVKVVDATPQSEIGQINVEVIYQ